MKTLLVIKVDTNDGDYNEVSHILDGDKIDDLPVIRKVAEAIKSFEPYTSKTYRGTEWTHRSNFPDLHWRDDLGQLSAYEYYVESGKVTEEEFEIFSEYTPWCGDYGFHTVESVRVLNIESEEELL